MQKICLIIPCYNEVKRLNLDIFIDFLCKYENLTICFVDDGSKDQTLEVLGMIQKSHSKQITVLKNVSNKGKAEAVRLGVIHCLKLNQYDFIGYWDADMSTPFEALTNLLASFDNNKELKFVMGSRVKRMGASINRKTFRHITGRIFSTFSSIILKLPVYDSQCGAKLFRSDIASILFDEPFISKWLFDVELLARLRNYLGIEKTLISCVEVPLKQWKEVGGSKLRFTYLMKVPIELLKIHFHYNK